MRHPSEGVLRRLLDEPEAVPAAERDHAGSCSRCEAALRAMHDDAALVGAALSLDGADVGADADVDAAWRQVAARAATTTRGGRAPARARRSVREVLRTPLVAVAAAAALVTGVGTAAATGWLSIFQTERVAPLSLDPADLLALPDLAAYGELVTNGGPAFREVADAAAAAAATGLRVPEVAELPRGVSGEPTYRVGREVTATFTFSAERAATTAASLGEALPPVPPGLDGAQVRLAAGPGVLQLWESDSGAPALLVARATAPRASSSGVPFETVRDYLLSLPGVPDDVARQLRAFAADGTTLPLPVPAEQVTTRTTEVDGAAATVLTTRNRALSAVVWVEDGALTAVVGSLDADEVLRVARELR